VNEGLKRDQKGGAVSKFVPVLAVGSTLTQGVPKTQEEARALVSCRRNSWAEFTRHNCGNGSASVLTSKTLLSIAIFFLWS
jgi:hypothetical protein